MFASHSATQMEASVHQPSFGQENTRAKSKRDQRSSKITKESIVLVGGSGNQAIAQSVSNLIDVPLADAILSKFNDGECNIKLNSDVRGKHVYIMQSCAAPVNDNVLELLLIISCCRRAGAKRITAVIPYFAYKHHRRFTAVSTKHHSRFLTSGAMDFAKMLEVMEVDSVVSVDIQRPGQGHEACYFSAHVPLECVVTTNLFANYLADTLQLSAPMVVVAPNAESLQKAKKFQVRLQQAVTKSGISSEDATPVGLAGFFQTEDTRADAETPNNSSHLQLLGHQKFEGADVVIVDDIIDSADTVCTVAAQVKALGARNVIVCASHGIFGPESVAKIEASDITKVVVTDTLSKPTGTEKIVQLSVAPMLAKIILAEHFRRKLADENEFEADVETII
jgi:ribose-phosphate pyrophosphokinase